MIWGSLLALGCVAPFVMSLAYIWVDIFQPQSVAPTIAMLMPISMVTALRRDHRLCMRRSRQAAAARSADAAARGLGRLDDPDDELGAVSGKRLEEMGLGIQDRRFHHAAALRLHLSHPH